MLTYEARGLVFGPNSKIPLGGDNMNLLKKSLLGLAAIGFVAGSLATAPGADAKTINVRIGSGHPPTVVYAGLMKNFFIQVLRILIQNMYNHQFK